MGNLAFLFLLSKGLSRQDMGKLNIVID